MSKYSEKKRRQAEEARAEEARRRVDKVNRPRSEFPSSCGDMPLEQLVAKCTVYAKSLVAHGMEECGNTFLDLCRRSTGMMSFTDKTIRKALMDQINT